MLPVVKINNLYKEIIIPVNESITADMLLDKYGIVADVEIVGQSGGGSDLTFPYNLFHSFFSLFTPSKVTEDKDKGEEALKVDEDKDDQVKVLVTEDKDGDKVTEDKDEDKVTEDKVTEDEDVKGEEDKDKDEDKDEDKDDQVKVTEDKEVKVTEEDKGEDNDVDKEVKVTEDEEVRVTEDKDEDGVNIIDSKKVMKITIKSINGLRPW